jgi:hypothetical protein
MSKKVDLTLLKRLVAELEGHLNVAEHILTNVNPDVNEMVIEADEAIGLAGGIMHETLNVMVGIQEMVNAAQNVEGRTDLLSKILSPFKGSGSN